MTPTCSREAEAWWREHRPIHHKEQRETPIYPCELRRLARVAHFGGKLAPALRASRLAEAARGAARVAGVAAAGMRARAERAGVSAPTAYQYFAARDHVLVELLIERNTVTNAAVTARPSRRRDPVERAVATLRRVVRVVEEEPNLLIAMMRAYIPGAPEGR